MMTEEEIGRLAAAVSALRPDWPAKSLRAFIANQLGHRSYGDAAVAFAWIATRTKTETPRLMLEAGPWWRACMTEVPTTPRGPKPDEECRRHLGQFAHSCSGCAADKLAGDPSPEPLEVARARAAQEREREHDPAHPVAAARAAFAQARASLCGPHGVRITHCTDCRQAAAAKTPRDHGESMPGATEEPQVGVGQPGRGSEAATGTVSPAAPGSITGPQLTRLHIMFGQAGLSDRDERLGYCQAQTGRPIETTKNLSKNEATLVMEMLTHLLAYEAATTTTEGDPA